MEVLPFVPLGDGNAVTMGVELLEASCHSVGFESAVV